MASASPPRALPPPSLSTLPAEILYHIFKKFGRPSKLALALSCPHMLHALAKYHDLDRYRGNALFQRKLGVPDSVPWEDSRAQGAIIRWIAVPGSDDIDSPGSDVPEEDEEEAEDEFGLGVDNETEEKPYEETDEGEEEKVVQKIMQDWLQKRCGVEGEMVFCADCYRFMRLGPDAQGRGRWADKMLTRGLWSRHCGPCEDSYGIPRDAVLT